MGQLFDDFNELYIEFHSKFSEYYDDPPVHDINFTIDAQAGVSGLVEAAQKAFDAHDLTPEDAQTVHDSLVCVQHLSIGFDGMSDSLVSDKLKSSLLSVTGEHDAEKPAGGKVDTSNIGFKLDLDL